MAVGFVGQFAIATLYLAHADVSVANFLVMIIGSNNYCHHNVVARRENRYTIMLVYHICIRYNQGSSEEPHFSVVWKPPITLRLLFG